MQIDVQLHTPVRDSFRVQQILGMFDLPESIDLHETFHGEIPGPEKDWTIGMIVGPSGSGKTSIARAAFGDRLHIPRPWHPSRAVIDCLGDLPIRQITQTLTAVGFGSPRSWLKPFAVLSNGEKFRCEVARAFLLSAAAENPLPRTRGRGQGEGQICKMRRSPIGPSPQPSPPITREREPGDFPSPAESASRTDQTSFAPSPLYSGERAGLRGQSANDAITKVAPDKRPRVQERENLVVIDEFTSVVDRTVARIASAAISNAIRSNKINARLVAITCHDDVIPWLQPDWVLDMAGGRLAWGRVRRPSVPLDIRPADRSAWAQFRPHHYLSGNLHPAARCFVGWIEGRPAAFTAVLPFPHPRRPGWREHRTVCLPDFQGIGIGSAMSDFLAGVFSATGRPYFSTTGHPAMIAHRIRSTAWQMRRKPGIVSAPGPRGAEKTGMRQVMSRDRITAGFEYVGPKYDSEAQELGLSVPTVARAARPCRARQKQNAGED